MTFFGATFEPIEELRKLTASLLTPTMMSKKAITARIPTPIIRISMLMVSLMSFPPLSCFQQLLPQKTGQI
jgi:hypothetical protein